MKKSIPLLLVSLALVAACASSQTEEPLRVTGPKNASFNADFAQCRAAAEQYDQKMPENGALAGAAIGGLVGALENESDNLTGALAGAVIGGGVGALEGRQEMRKSHRDMTVRCMQNKGHPVIG